MTNELTVSYESYMAAKRDLIRRTYCQGATDDEMDIFITQCIKTRLDPISNQIYFVKRPGRDGSKMTIQTSIDGFRLVAERTRRYAPGRDPEYQYDEKGNLISATAFIKKMTPDGTWHEVSSKAFLNEYVPRGKDGQIIGNFWKKMPHVMIAKCAEANALRKAFPMELSGIYTDDEMAQADKPEAKTMRPTDGLAEAEAEVVEEKTVSFDYAKSLDECETLANDLWCKFRLTDPSLDGIMWQYLPHYIHSCQDTLRHRQDVRDRFASWATKPREFLHAAKTWYDKRGAAYIERVGLDKDFYRDEAN